MEWTIHGREAAFTRIRGFGNQLQQRIFLVKSDYSGQISWSLIRLRQEEKEKVGKTDRVG